MGRSGGAKSLMKDIITEIWATARRNKLRTALTGFAVAWGIFMLIFLLGAGNGLINAQMQNSDRYLVNSMKVFGGWTSVPYDGLNSGRSISLNDADVRTTELGFTENVDEVGAMLWQNSVNISLGQQYVNGSLTGVYPNYVSINKQEMLKGRFINDIDLRERRKVLVISEDHAKELEPHGGTIVGRYVNVDGLMFRVVGVYKADRTMRNDDVFTAFSTLKTIYGKGDKAGTIEFSFHGLTTEQQNEEFESRYRTRLNANHRAAPNDENSVWLWNRYTDNIQMQKGIGIIRTALWIVGLFTLLSGIVGVSNIMLITVKERTREFGIRKAIGAKPWSILKLIIIESVVITSLFGYIGMLCGIAANEYMDATIGHEQVDTGLFRATMFVNPTVGLDVCVEVMLVMIVAGTVAGLIPAIKAARIRPIEALRAE